MTLNTEKPNLHQVHITVIINSIMLTYRSLRTTLRTQQNIKYTKNNSERKHSNEEPKHLLSEVLHTACLLKANFKLAYPSFIEVTGRKPSLWLLPQWNKALGNSPRFPPANYNSLSQLPQTGIFMFPSISWCSLLPPISCNRASHSDSSKFASIQPRYSWASAAAVSPGTH